MRRLLGWRQQEGLVPWLALASQHLGHEAVGIGEDQADGLSEVDHVAIGARSREQPVTDLGEALEVGELDRVMPNVSGAPVGLDLLDLEHMKGGTTNPRDRRVRALHGAFGSEHLRVERSEPPVVSGADREVMQ